MKIHTQLILMVISITMVPVIVITLAIGVHNMYVGWQNQTMPVYEEITKYIGTMDHDQWDDFKELVRNRGSDVDVVIINKDYVVGFSTIPEFKPGMIMDLPALTKDMKDALTRYSYKIDRVPQATQEAYVLARLPSIPLFKAAVNRAQDIIAIILAVILVISVISAIVVARSLTSSILAIERATKRVAAGDLDFPIQIKGNSEMRSLASSIDSMRLSLKEDFARRSRLIMGVSHDLKSPLALAKGYLEAVRDGVYDNEEGKQKYFEIITSKLDQLDDLINDLLDFIRVDTKEWRISLKSMSMQGFLERFSRGVSKDAEVFDKDFKAELRLPKELLVSFDERLIQRSLENLVFNAFRYSGPGVVVGIRAYTDKQDVLIDVFDNGVGIAETDLSHVFEPFYRASSSRREPGMGIGLSTVKSLVESHGWSITARSHAGETVFTIRIPGVSGGLTQA